MPAPLPEGFQIRALSADDSLEELTELLHRGYKRLAEMGLNFVATTQDVETTRRRANDGECYVGILDRRIIATITLYPPERCGGCPWYARPDVASFGQFSVEPGLQGSGIGGALMEFVESRARALGAAELALDTAEPAAHLIAYYGRRGYRFIEHVKWNEVNYRSVIMSKTLT